MTAADIAAATVVVAALVAAVKMESWEGGLGSPISSEVVLAVSCWEGSSELDSIFWSGSGKRPQSLCVVGLWSLEGLGLRRSCVDGADKRCGNIKEEEEGQNGVC